ncbi:MAG: polysaccharide biosynthesis protein [Firmicutes bacterium]|nr:polysaccharide biosynthesis protein [Bacillota bacterium]
MTKESFLRGAVVLTLASLVSRMIGLAYMIALPRLIYDDGMGLYQLVKPIHYFAAVVALAGVPVAIAKLTAEKVALGSKRDVQRVFQVGTALMVLSGGVVGLALLFGANWFAFRFARDMGVAKTLALLGPACFFLALSAAMRGFFQGLQCMTPTAVAQIIDQLVRVLVTMLASAWLRPRGVEMAVTGIAIGFIAGEFTGWLVLVIYYAIKGQKLMLDIPEKQRQVPESFWQIAKKIVLLASPAVVATILWPVMQLADSLLIPQRMQMAGFSPAQIREGLGHLGMALTLAHFPNVVTVALATSLVPAISEAWALKSKRLVQYRTQEALRIALIFGIPSCAALFVLAKPLSQLLFGYVQVAAPLAILSFGAISLGIIQASTGVLQGLGQMLVPVRNLALGVVCKFLLNYYLLAQPQIGMLGAAWSTTASWAVIALLNLASVYKEVDHALSLRASLLYPSLVTIFAALWMYLTQDTLAYFIPEGAASFLALISGFVLYFLFLMPTKSLTKRDLHLLPLFGKPLARTLQAWGFLRS